MPRGPNPMRRHLRQNEFYCVSCRKPIKVDSDDIKFKQYSSSKRKAIPMLKSRCVKCDSKVNRIVKTSAARAMKKKYA